MFEIILFYYLLQTMMVVTPALLNSVCRIIKLSIDPGMHNPCTHVGLNLLYIKSLTIYSRHDADIKPSKIPDRSHPNN